MRPINTKALRIASRELDRAGMMQWLQAFTDKLITVAEFDGIMRKHLPKEQHYQTEVIHFLKENYPAAFVWKAAAGPYSQQGIPDVCAIIDGHFFGFEIKRPYIGETSEIQKRTIELINAAGGTATVVSFWQQAKEVIDKWKTANV